MAEWIVEANSLGDLVEGLWVGGKRLVRCKDCIHLHDHDCPIDWGKTDDDYCSFGEQKDEVEE